MESQLQNLAALAFIDQRLDELNEDFGDLPVVVKQKEEAYSNASKMVEETKNIIEEIKNFCSTTKVTLVELKDKEEQLAKQQFLVRNNKEFDAITKELETIRTEHLRLSDSLRSEGIKLENLKGILDNQLVAQAKAQFDHEEKKQEMEAVTGEQNDELNYLRQKRIKVLPGIREDFLEEYERIRRVISDAAVCLRKNSCTGCFSAVPPQKIVEIRNNTETIFLCENCGRILMPEDFMVDDDVIETL